MALVADILLIAGALGAAFYCIVLSRRLSRFSNLEDGVGGAVATLSTQVAEMTATLEKTEAAARESAASLEDSTKRAETAARNLELLLASMHDIPAQAEPQPEAPRSGGSPEFRRSTATFRRREAAE